MRPANQGQRGRESFPGKVQELSDGEERKRLPSPWRRLSCAATRDQLGGDHQSRHDLTQGVAAQRKGGASWRGLARNVELTLASYSLVLCNHRVKSMSRLGGKDGQ